MFMSSRTEVWSRGVEVRRIAMEGARIWVGGKGSRIC